jgi:hypothetical protein
LELADKPGSCLVGGLGQFSLALFLELEIDTKSLIWFHFIINDEYAVGFYSVFLLHSCNIYVDLFPLYLKSSFS